MANRAHGAAVNELTRQHFFAASRDRISRRLEAGLVVEDVQDASKDSGASIFFVRVAGIELAV